MFSVIWFFGLDFPSWISCLRSLCLCSGSGLPVLAALFTAAFFPRTHEPFDVEWLLARFVCFAVAAWQHCRAELSQRSSGMLRARKKMIIFAPEL